MQLTGKVEVVFLAMLAVSLMLHSLLSSGCQDDIRESDNGEMTVTLEAGDYQIDQEEEYSLLCMEGFGSMLYPKAPKLPARTFLIGLPPGAELLSIAVVDSDYVELSGKYRIVPSPPVIYGREGEEPGLEEDEAIYGSEEVYPPCPYSYLGMGQMRKYSFARLGFCPVAYYPANDKLAVYQSITIRITYQINNTVSVETLSDAVMDDIASRIIVNYSSIKSYYPSTDSRATRLCDYVIITTDSLQGAVEPLVNWKEAIGYTVDTVTIDWIESNYHGRDLPEKIRNFLIANYAGWGLEYVLIVGSHATIPMRYCYPDPSDHSHNGAVPTDYYYADLSGNWDSDNDGYFGECGQDTVNYHPEVIVGRIPIDNVGTVRSICQKSETFEQDSGSWKSKALLLAAMLNYSNEDYGQLVRTDKAVLMEKCCDDILSVCGYSCEKMYEEEGLAPSTYVCDHPLSNSNVLDEEYGWPSGYGLVNWGAHGGVTGVSRWLWEHDSNGIPESYEINLIRFISKQDVSCLDDKHPSIVFSSSCLNAYPERSDNLGNSLLKQGAVAFIGATREVWYTLGWQDEGDGANASIDYWFFYYLVKENQKTGNALYNAQVQVCDHYWLQNWKQWRSLFAFCLYGDPSLGVETLSTLAASS